MKMVAVNESKGRVERKEAKCTSAMVARKSRFLGRRRPERSDYFESHTSFASECSTRLLTLSGKRTTFSPPRLRFLRSQTKKRRNKKEKGGKKRNKRRRSSFFANFQRKEGNGTFPSVFQPSSEGTRDVVSVLAFSRDCSRFSWITREDLAIPDSARRQPSTGYR